MPETSETLLFSEENKCSVCTQIEKKNEIDWKKRSDLLDELINKYKGKYDYDCMVPFLRQRLDFYTLVLSQRKKLKPLVVRFDHNFYRSNIEKNNEKTFSKLGVEYINFKPNFELVKKTMLESLIRRGDFAGTVMLVSRHYQLIMLYKKKFL